MRSRRELTDNNNENLKAMVLHFYFISFLARFFFFLEMGMRTRPENISNRTGSSLQALSTCVRMSYRQDIIAPESKITLSVKV